ncbi:hypothetical protein [Collinsella sp. An2]|uniref:hypothetical protein n=1 Tax=Collinsella sp. An2 TaxID=1965585 RepID=UPI000B39A02A|nr:hypothetical protein [Collinsella sp. An2]OUP09770.1 hypothetical protein B5F33_04065 [Collinsella sp. An2]
MPGTRHAPDRDPERLVHDYADLVLRVCYTHLRSTTDAEDVAGDRSNFTTLYDIKFDSPWQ